MAIVTCSTTCKSTRSKLLLLLVAISFISLALAIPQLISVYREDHIDVVHHSSDHLFTTARSKLSLTNASTGSSFAQKSTRSPSVQPFAAQLATTSQSEEGANRSANYVMPSEIRDAFKGMVPEKVAIPDGRNIHFSARTTVSSYVDRFPVVFLTWFQTAPSHNLHILSDRNSTPLWAELASAYGFDFVQANCSTSHGRRALWCKTQASMERYYQELEAGNGLDWYCHVDDDMYVNIPALNEVLEQLMPQGKVYVGAGCHAHQSVPKLLSEEFKLVKKSFGFHCGAIYCLSKPLMVALEPHIRGDNLHPLIREKLNDDLAIGFLVDCVLNVRVTFCQRMITHLNTLSLLSFERLKTMAAISYGDYLSLRKKGQISFMTENHVIIPNAAFNKEDDPTRFLSYHCVLYPSTSWCHQRTS